MIAPHRPLNRPAYRTLWLSDVHLGMRACRVEALIGFLRHHDAETIYLVGDIIDGLRLKRSWTWNRRTDEVIRLLLDKAAGGADITYIPGNHDAFLRNYGETTVAGIRIRRDAVHRTADGRRLAVLHGDEFDGVISVAPWLALLGHGFYHFTTWINLWLNRCRRRLGLPYWSLAGYLKQHSRGAARYVAAFEREVRAEAARRRMDGVVCGHIHQPALETRDDFTYANTGDWVDHCTALVEHHDGRLELLRGEETVPSFEQAVHAHRLPRREFREQPAAAQA